MYDLSNVARDFPWAVSYPDAPDGLWWRLPEAREDPGADLSGWVVSEWEWLPAGWGDVIRAHLGRLDLLVRRNDWHVLVLQVKEKYGTLRFYYWFVDDDGLGWEQEELEPDIGRFEEIVREMEAETGRVCCRCGTREGVECYGGWVHYSCPDCERREQQR